MIIMQKLLDTVYEYLLILIKFIPVSIITTLVKTLINLKNKTEENFTNIILEFFISILLSCIIGYLAYTYVGEKEAILLTALVAWSGSKVTEFIDKLISKYLKKYDTDKDDTNSSLRS